MSAPITAEQFEQATGYPPQDDDLERCNCTIKGGGHSQCGWDEVRGMPRFVPGPSKRNEEVLRVLRMQHNAIDLLMAKLILATAAEEHKFMPSQSEVWPAVVEGNALIRKLEGAPGVRVPTSRHVESRVVDTKGHAALED